MSNAWGTLNNVEHIEIRLKCFFELDLDSLILFVTYYVGNTMVYLRTSVANLGAFFREIGSSPK
jgi:hypothetical protein